MIVENIQNMINLAGEKKKHLESLLKLTELQEEIIVNEDLDELETILAKKEDLMATIDGIDGKFLENYEEAKEKSNIKSLEDLDTRKFANLKDLKEAVKEINKLLNTISLKDRNNVSKMKENMDKSKADLKQIKDGKKAYKGYNFEEPGSILIDEKK